MPDDTLPVSEERLRALFEHASDLVSILGMDGTYQFVSPSHRRILGYAPEELQGTNAFALVHPDDFAGIADIIEHGLVTPGAVETVELRVRHADGAWRTMEIVGTNRLDDPAIGGIIVNAHDITERKRAEEERAALLMRAQAARAEALARAGERDIVFEAMADGVLVCDSTGRAAYMNAAYRRLLELDAASLERVRSPENRGAVFAARDMEGHLLTREQWPMSRVLRGEVMTGAHTMDMVVHTLDGREIVINASGAPVRDAAGDIQGGVVIFRDVTERRTMERRAHEELDALLDMAAALAQGSEQGASDEADDISSLRAVAQQLVALTRNVFACTHVNIIGVTPSHELQPLAQVGLSPERERQWRERIAGNAVVGDGELFDALWARLGEGESIVIDTSRAPFDRMLNPFGLTAYLMTPMRVGKVPVGLLVVAYDGGRHVYTEEDFTLARAVARLATLAVERERLVRERETARASELALREANSRMEEFLSIAGHELRTPLTSVLGNIQLAERWMNRVRSMGTDTASPSLSDSVAARIEGTYQVLSRVERQVRLLNRLVGDLLDTSRIQAGRLALRLAPCDLSALLRDVAREQRQRDPARALRLEMAGAEGVVALADEDRIIQVVTNYLSNALKYSDDDRPVELGLRVEGAAARVWVRDEGPGLAEGEQELVWERFYRSEGAGHRYGSSVGMGLGLHISRTIIQLHGGQVGVDSSPGEGATFWFTLPLLDAPR